MYLQPRPITTIELYFGEVAKNIRQAITNADFEPKKFKIKLWRDKIDEILVNIKPIGL